MSYSSDQITILTSLEAIRHRPGMYIGATDKNGLHHLVFELVDNAVDEALNGYADRIEVQLHSDGSCRVFDNGRGIPFEKSKNNDRSVCELVFTTLHSGGKFHDSAYRISGGLHGVGLSCVNALSEQLHVQVVRNHQQYEQRFLRGVPQAKGQLSEASASNGTCITFLPDARIFRSTLDFDPELIAWRLHVLSYLLPGTTLVLKREDGSQKTFIQPNGIRQFVIDKNIGRRPVHDDPIFLHAESEQGSNPWSMSVALQWTQLYSKEIASYVNTIPTPQGGVHQEAMLQALITWSRKACSTHAQGKMLNISEQDVLEGLTLIIRMEIQQPEFYGQTKEKLNNEDVSEALKDAFLESVEGYFSAQPRVAQMASQRIYESYISRVVGAQSGARSRMQVTPIVATPEVYRSQFGERSKNWHASATWIADEELLAEHGSSCTMPPESVCLDVCCGSGVVGNSFRGRVSKIIGLDITPEMVELSKKRLDEVHLGTVFDIPFPDNHFEVVCNREVMHLMPEPQKMMSEVFRVLKPGGQFVVGQIIPYSALDAPWMFRIFKKKQPLLYHMFLEDEFEQLLCDAGLTNISCKERLVWEDIDVWIDTIETSSWHRHEIRKLYHHAPQSIRDIHPFRIDPDGRIHDCWRWLIYTGYKPE